MNIAMRLTDLFEAPIDPMMLSPWDFDQSSHGWRNAGPLDAQIKVLVSYLARYAATPETWKPETPSTERQIKPVLLWFHLGQVYAMAGETGNAVKAFSQTTRTDDAQWNRYALATMAFIRQDRNSFERYANGENYNSDTLERLRKNWGKSYEDAY